MPIYDFNTDVIGELLIPPVLRKPKHLDWLSTILSPIQKLRDKVFNDYKGGVTYSNATAYSNVEFYYLGSKVIWTDRRVYEMIVDDEITGVAPNDTTYWIKQQEIFIGTDERVKYSSQKKLFEYALNKYFLIGAPPADQIYITNNFYVNASFIMANSSELSSNMPNNNIYQQQYLSEDYSYSTGNYDYTIYFPVTAYNALASTATDREMIVRNFADKYNLAGMIYDIQTY